VAGYDHEHALAWEGDWSSVDVLVVDAADEGSPGDQFPGVAVVRRARAGGTGDQPVIVVVTGHYLHDGLRHRMAAAGADFYFLRSELRSSESLVDVVMHPERHRRGVPPVADPAARDALGAGDVEAFVGWVDRHGAATDLSGEEGRRDEPRSRRWARLRRAASEAGGIEPRNLTTGQAPLGQDTPSLRQLGRLWRWAARIGRPDH
jgi:hypothetical protein